MKKSKAEGYKLLGKYYTAIGKVIVTVGKFLFTKKSKGDETK